MGIVITGSAIVGDFEVTGTSTKPAELVVRYEDKIKRLVMVDGEMALEDIVKEEG